MRPVMKKNPKYLQVPGGFHEDGPISASLEPPAYDSLTEVHAGSTQDSGMYKVGKVLGGMTLFLGPRRNDKAIYISLTHLAIGEQKDLLTSDSVRALTHDVGLLGQRLVDLYAKRLREANIIIATAKICSTYTGGTLCQPEKAALTVLLQQAVKAITELSSDPLEIVRELSDEGFRLRVMVNELVQGSTELPYQGDGGKITHAGDQEQSVSKAGSAVPLFESQAPQPDEDEVEMWTIINEIFDEANTET